MKTDKKIKLSKDESLFVRGPLSRFKELSFAFKVLFNFIKAFRKMHFIGPCITVFGSARFTKDSDHYKNAEKIGAALAKTGFTVMTGGGPGDELFEALTLIQTKVIQDFPVVIFDKEYHKELCQHINLMAENESISPEDMKLLFVTDSVEDLITHIETYSIKKFGLVKKQVEPKWWLGEREKNDS